jgi:RND family efflux transporter MFP subunit
VRRLVKFLLPLVLIAGGFAAFKALQATRPERPVAEVGERVWRVEVAPVELRARAPELVLYGRVETAELLRVAASAPGRIAELPVRDGERVAAGQLLVQIDERDLLPRRQQVEAEIAELKAQLASEDNRVETDRKALIEEQKLVDLARDAVARAQRLKTQRVAAEADLDAAEETLARQSLALANREMAIADHGARRQALEARLQSAEARLAEVELELERSRVLAPFDGIVAGVEVTAGDQVKRDDVLLRFYDPGRLEIRARIPAPYQDEVTAALAAGEALGAWTEVAGRPLGLRLARIAGQGEASGVDGFFAVEAEASVLRLGQMLTVRLTRPKRPDTVAVPFAAVYGGERVYRLEDGRMRGVAVEVLGGVSNGRGGEELLVRSPGLAEGDRIVVTPLPNAVDGLRVEVVE